jgi:hypothetical protein
MASDFDASAIVLGSPPAGLGDAVEAATGCTIAELLASPSGPAWDMLAIIIGPMIDAAPDVPNLAHALSVSGITAGEWAVRVAAAIGRDA